MLAVCDITQHQGAKKGDTVAQHPTCASQEASAARVRPHREQKRLLMMGARPRPWTRETSYQPPDPALRRYQAVGVNPCIETSTTGMCPNSR